MATASSVSFQGYSAWSVTFQDRIYGSVRLHTTERPLSWLNQVGVSTSQEREAWRQAGRVGQHCRHRASVRPRPPFPLPHT